MTTTKQPSTLATNERGASIDIHRIAPGMYVWHRGAYRLVTAVDPQFGRVRMGRHAVRSWFGPYEVLGA